MLALSWFAPILASEVVQGQPHLAGPAIAGGAAVTTVLGYASTRAFISGGAKLASAGARMIGGKSGGRRFSGGGPPGAARPAIDYAGMKPPPPPPPATPPSGGSKT
ncbi:MAG: hypothetical protein IPL62_19350 [Caulobacteraceae bacterium]|nr:hypothetical protein [Caulobacteraceae bacterium]